MCVDIVISNIFNLNEHFLFLFFLFSEVITWNVALDNADCRVLPGA